MGSSSSSQDSTPFIQIDPSQHCSLITQTNQYKVFENSRGEQYEKYLINKGIEQTKLSNQKLSYPKNYLQNRPSFQQNYQYRLTHRSKYFVELLYAAPNETSFSCNFSNKKGDFNVVTQRINHRLSDMYNLSFQNAITILFIALKGFKNLYNYNGILWIKDSMIGVNQNNQVRVWLNGNFALNMIEPLPVSLLKLPVEAQQDLIVNNLIDMISSKTFPSPEWKELLKLRMEMMEENVKTIKNVDSENPIYGHQKLLSNGSLQSNSILQNKVNGSKAIEASQNSNKMTFDLGLEMVQAVLIRFGLEDLKESNKVYDLFNQGSNGKIVRENPQTIYSGKNLDSLQIAQSQKSERQNFPKKFEEQKKGLYPNKIHQIKSHIGLQNHLIRQHINGRQIYEPLTNHPAKNMNHVRTSIIPKQENKLKNIVEPPGIKTQETVPKNFHNPFVVESEPLISETKAKTPSFDTLPSQKIPINPFNLFNEVTKVQQPRSSTLYVEQSNLIREIPQVTSNFHLIQNKNVKNTNGFQEIKNSIMAQNSSQPTFSANMPSKNLSSPPSTFIQSSHPQIRISFNNTQSTANLSSFIQSQPISSNLYPARQNSLINIQNQNFNRSNSSFSSLSQSPKTLVRFGSSLDKRSTIVTTGKPTTTMGFNNENLGNPLIQRRSGNFNTKNIVNFVSPTNINSPYPSYAIGIQRQSQPNFQNIRMNDSPINYGQKNYFKEPEQGPINEVAESILMLDSNSQQRKKGNQEKIVFDVQSQKVVLFDNTQKIHQKNDSQEHLKVSQAESVKMTEQYFYSKPQDVQQPVQKSSKQEIPPKNTTFQLLQPTEQPEELMELELTPFKDSISQSENPNNEEQLTYSASKHYLPANINTSQQLQSEPQNPSQTTNLMVLTSYENQTQPKDNEQQNQENQQNQPVIYISVNRCPTPDGSLHGSDEIVPENVSDITYDEKNDPVLENKRSIEEKKSQSQQSEPYPQQSNSDFINMETGKFIFDPTGSNLLANNLHINNSDQNSEENLQKNIKSNNSSSEGMYKYELKDTTNLFSLNSIKLPETLFSALVSSSQEEGKNIKDSDNSKIKKKVTISQEPLGDSQANTIISKLNKWEKTNFSSQNQTKKEITENPSKHIEVQEDYQVQTSNPNQYKSKQASYMNSEYFAKYLSSLNSQSLKSPFSSVSPLPKYKESSFSSVSQNQVSSQKQNILLPILNESITYKELRNLLNSSS